MVAFYNQVDQDIYTGGEHFIPQEQYRLGYTAPPSIAHAPTTGITNTQAAVPYIWPPQGGGDGGGGAGGYGLFGNLDKSNMKMFDKNVYSMDMAKPGATMTASFKPQQVQGFYNPKTGQYQTFEGKNINHLGLNIKPVFGSILESMGLGKNKYGLDFEHDLGSTEGTFTHGWDSGIDKIKAGWDDETEKWKNLGIFKKWRNKKDKENIEFIDEKVGDTDPADVGTTTTTTTTGDGGGGGYTGDPRGQHAGIDYSGANYGPHTKSRSTYSGPSRHHSMADGGRIGYNRGRVVNPGGYAGEEEFEDEDVFEFMRDQGVPHGEMVEGPSPFDLRVEELMDEGMSWQEAYNIATEEFGRTTEGPQDFFSEEGIASIV